MTDIHFLHTADVHLGTPFLNLSDKMPEEWATALQEASARSLARIVDVAIARQVDFVSIAGDLFDEADPPVSVQYEVVRQFQRLHAAAIQVVICHGNHDPLVASPLFPWPDNVHLLEDRTGEHGVASIQLLIRGQRVQLSGFSYASAELYGSQVTKFERLPTADFAIALYHGQVGPAVPGHAAYAAASIEQLAEHTGFDVWALGHLHSYQVLRADKPVVFYPGTPQGRDISEVGRKGAVWVRLSTSGRTQLTFVPTSTIDWCKLSVDVSACVDFDAIWREISRRLPTSAASVRHLIHLHLYGQSPLYAELADEGARALFQQVAEEDGWPLWIYRYSSACEPEIDWTVWQNTEGYLGELLTLLNQLDTDTTGALEAVLASLDDEAREMVQQVLRHTPVSELMRQARQSLFGMMKLH